MIDYPPIPALNAIPPESSKPKRGRPKSKAVKGFDERG
jgi:hypothetical protein